jgi:hypothetical protein
MFKKPVPTLALISIVVSVLGFVNLAGSPCMGKAFLDLCLPAAGLISGVLSIIIREKSLVLAVFGLIANVTAAALVPWFG